MGFCNSCGKPIVKEDYGTNEDGSLNPEFCKDCFSTSFYAHSKGATNPCCTSGETYKSVNYVVIRGGSYDSYKPAQYTVTARNKAKANLEFLHVGFRLAVNP